MISYAQLEASLQGKTGGRKLTNIPNIYNVIQEVLDTMISFVDLPSAIRKVPLLTPLVSEPYMRLLPNDFAPEGLIDMFERDYNTTPPMIKSGIGPSEFMRKYRTGLINIEHIDGKQYMNFRNDEYSPVYVLDNCEDSTNGTWQAYGVATDVAISDSYKYIGEGSVKFNVPVTTSSFGVFKNDFADVASATDQTYITMYAFFPQYIPSVTIRYGIDATNYKEVTATLDWESKRFTTGWNLIAFDLSTATTTGTVGNDDITYFAYIIDTNITTAPTTSFYIDGIYLTTGFAYDISFYSNSVVVDQWGSRREANLISSVNDSLLLNPREKILFLQQFSDITSIDNRPAS